MNGMPLRLLLDHNVGRGVALALRQAGLDVLFVGDVDPHMPDAAILRWAVQEQRLIVTQDLDFGTLVYPLRPSSRRCPLAPYVLVQPG
jgi:predicted nuclease of predicted toxin-antitoxin system